MKRGFLLWWVVICGVVLGLSAMWWALSEPVTAGGPTYVSGPIITDTVWTKENSPYIVTGTVSVESPAVLTIEAGVEVRFNLYQGLVVRSGAKLVAVGTPTEPITFTASTPQRRAWSGLSWFGSHNRLEWATVEYADYGLLLSPGSGHNTVSHSTFRYHGDYNDPGTTGAAIYGTTDYSVFSDNLIQTSEHGIYLLKSSGNLISGNRIDDCDGVGIALKGETTYNVGNQVIDNLVSDCGGEGIYLYKQQDLTIRRNEVRHSAQESFVTAAFGPGVRLLQATTRPVKGGVVLEDGSNALFEANRIHNNGAQAGLYISATQFVTITQNLVYLNDADGILYTQSISPAVYNNAFYGNGAFEWASASADPLDVSGNWWGTNEPQWGVHLTGTVVYTPWVTFAFTVTPHFLPADGVSTATLAISLVDGAGHYAPDGFPVHLAADRGNLSTFEVTTTSGLGHAYLQAPIFPALSHITATAPLTVELSDWVSFLPLPPHTLTLTASPYSVEADGASASTIMASVKDALGNPAPDGTVVAFTTTLGLFPGGITHTLYPTGTDLVEAESGEVTKASSLIAYS
ncbi:MAG: hypothetical protein DRI61_14210, partial [Chloroflexi bacterium]